MNCRKMSVVCVCVCCLVLSATAYLQAATDNILSGNIKEAVVGSTDQNTNSGSGVKTGHIVDTAVTTAKIANGAVTAAKLAVPVYSKDEINALISGLQSQLTALQTENTALQNLLYHFSRVGNDIYITGANLHVVSGIPSDNYGNDQVNGLGNLILGYNVPRFWWEGTDIRTGSHNLVLGGKQNYSSFGGIVSGLLNTISGQASTVVGGYNSVASGTHSGIFNSGNSVASGTYSTVSGSNSSEASGEYSTVSGGYQNHAAGSFSTVSGGAAHSIGGTYNWAGGGLFQDQ